MIKLEGTQTEKNIQEALVIEGQIVAKLSYAYLIAKEERKFGIQQKLEELGALKQTPSNWLYGMLETKNVTTEECLEEVVSLYKKAQNKYEEFEQTAKSENLQECGKAFHYMKKHYKQNSDYLPNLIAAHTVTK